MIVIQQDKEDSYAAELWNKYEKKRTNKVKNELADHYFSFVQKIAIKMAEKLAWRVSPEELTSYGIDGLYKAIDKFDKSRGVKFESYASQRVRGSMIDGLRKNDTIPRSARILSDQFEQHRQRLQNHYGHRLSDSDVADIVGIDSKDFNSCAQKYVLSATSSLESNFDNESQNDMKQDSNIVLTDSHQDNPECRLNRKEFFSKLCSSLSKTEQKVIYLYYYEGLTMDRVAKHVGLSESRISQMRQEILNKLSQKVKKNPQYFEDAFSYVTSVRSASGAF